MTQSTAAPPTPAYDPGPEHWLDELARKLEVRGMTAKVDIPSLTLVATNPNVRGDIVAGGLSQPVRVVQTLAGAQWAWVWVGERLPREGRSDPTIEPFGFVWLTDYAADMVCRVLAHID